MIERKETARNTEAGFTLVEALTAMVVLAFGLMAVTNLMLVAASSNTVANHSTAAATSAAGVMDMIRGTSWPVLVAGGDHTDNDETGAIDCAVANANSYRCVENIAGVGMVYTRWDITAVPGTGRMYLIQVRSEGRGALTGARSRAEFTTFRSCTSVTAGCPGPP
jgi:Prokaryotic N-terminal methylation motif